MRGFHWREHMDVCKVVIFCAHVAQLVKLKPALVGWRNFARLVWQLINKNVPIS